MTDTTTTDDRHDGDNFDFAEELGMVFSVAILDIEMAAGSIAQVA